MDSKKPVRIKIAKEDERILVAGILIKNGYTVRAGRIKKTPTGKIYDNFLEIVDTTNEQVDGDYIG